MSPNHVIDVSRDFVGGGSLVLSHELAKFRIHRPCESGDKTFLDLSRDHVADVSCDFVDEIPSY